MKLTEYLKIASLSQVSLARAMNIKPATLNNWVKGKRIPRPYHLDLLKKVTHGKVTEKDFIE